MSNSRLAGNFTSNHDCGCSSLTSLSPSTRFGHSILPKHNHFLNRKTSSLGQKFHASQILFTYQLYELYSHHSQQCLTPTFDIAGGPPNALHRQPKMIVSSTYSAILPSPSIQSYLPIITHTHSLSLLLDLLTPLSTSSQTQTNTCPPAPFSRPHPPPPTPSSAPKS